MNQDHTDSIVSIMLWVSTFWMAQLGGLSLSLLLLLIMMAAALYFRFYLGWV